MGRLLVVSGPSGVGKTSIVTALRQRLPGIHLSVSATTRTPRPGEQDGVEYRFLSAETFEGMEAAGEFLETATVYGERYGTPRAPVEEALARCTDVVLEIDVQGARQVKRSLPAATLVFIEPPSWEVLVDRLTGRETEDPDARDRRLRAAHREFAVVDEFDHAVVNRTIGGAVEELIRILEGTRGPDGPPPAEPERRRP